jgi:methylated-DNA-[protein]-cysteine S-methyltransferase
MRATGIIVFETAIGLCGLAWNDRGLTGVQLPEGEPEATRTRLQRRFPGAVETAPPLETLDAARRIRQLLAGEAADLGPIELDLEATPAFERRVYAVARAIPPGRTLTYGEIAAEAGEPGAAQAVGQAMGRNPWPIVVPCHRVVGSGGKLGGFSATGGVKAKLKLLAIEGAMTKGLPLFDPD